MVATPPLPAVPDLPFVGRAELLRDLDRHLKDGVHLLLEGGAGIGKSRLAAEICFRQAERHKGRRAQRLFASPATRSFHFGALAPMGQPVGVIAGDLPGIFTWYLSQWRAQAAGGRPPLVWLDDVQHLDDLSATLFRHALDSDAIQLLAARRTPEPVPTDIDALQTEGRLRRVEVPTLSAVESSELATASCNRPLAEDELAEIHLLADGYPLFVRDLARQVGKGGLPRIARSRITSIGSRGCSECRVATNLRPSLHLADLGLSRHNN